MSGMSLHPYTKGVPIGRQISIGCSVAPQHLSHQLDATFHSVKEIETPLGMDDTQQMWKWADVGSCQMPRSPPMYPTLMVGESGARQPAASQVHHKTLFQWIVGNLSWLSQYDTVYVFVDNRALSGANPPDYWPFFAPWIKSRCEVIGLYQEKITAVYIPINSDTGLDQVHYTWAGAAVLEAPCLVYPTVNFVLADSDCVPTSLFEVRSWSISWQIGPAEQKQCNTTRWPAPVSAHQQYSSWQSPKQSSMPGWSLSRAIPQHSQRMLTWARKLQMQACHQPARIILMLVTLAHTSQGAWLIQLTANPQMNGSPHLVIVEPVS